MTKRDAMLNLRDKLVVLAKLADMAARGKREGIDGLRKYASNRQYVGPQLEVGREELNILFDTTDYGEDDGVPLADLAAGG